MAITIVNKYNEGNGVFGIPFITASNIAFSNNKLYLVSFYVNTDEATVTAISGGGITWVKITAASVLDSGPSNFQGGAMFRGLVTSGASTDKLTVTFDQGSEYSISVEEINGMDTTGTNGSGAIVQGAASSSDSGSATSLGCTLSAFGDPNNMAYGWAGKTHTDAYTPGSGFTELVDMNNAGGVGSGRFSTQYKLNDTSVSNSWATGCAALVAGVEIKVAPPATPPSPTPRVGWGRRAGN